MKDKKPLYRKTNFRARNVHRNAPSGDFRHERNTKAMKEFEGTHKSMHSDRKHGYDYTPLFKFLLSKVGQPWDVVFSEAVSRLDSEEPIFWMVETDAFRLDNHHGYFYAGESSSFSKLKIDENGILVKIKPDFVPYKPSCTCCTHTFNGKVYNNGPEYPQENKLV